jgi:hypothetical protein
VIPGVERSRPANRQPEGFYKTPETATLALIGAIGPYLDSVIHEPACGDGAMAKVFVRHGYDVIATDKVYRGYSRGRVPVCDFLVMGRLAPIVITNPPFHLADRFIAEAVSSKARLTAMLLKSDYWHAKSRIALHKAFPPRQELILTWRLDWTGQGRPTMNCTWFVWGDHLPVVTWLLPKPKGDVFA